MSRDWLWGTIRSSTKKTLGTFFDGFTWLFQVILFVTLGLLVNIDELLQPEVLLLGGLTGLFMILVARPAAVFLSLLPFRKFTTRARLYVSWVGLRGARARSSSPPIPSWPAWRIRACCSTSSFS